MASALRFSFTALQHVKLLSSDFGKLQRTNITKVLPTISFVQIRCSNFFTPGDNDSNLQGSLTGLSNPGRKRGRGKSARRPTDYDRGFREGEGKSGMQWPGLNIPVIKGDQRLRMHQQEPNRDYFDNIVKMRSQKSKFRKIKLSALERGFTGRSQAGESVGPPEPIGDYTFEGFNTRILEMKKVSVMTRAKKNIFRWSCLVVTGNGNGVGGIAVGKGTNSKAAIRKAKNRAGNHLQYIERYDGHTLYHPFFGQEVKTKIFAYRKQEGYGIVAHRVLKVICEIVGIHNIYAKVEGSTRNYQALTKAFFDGLRRQETHQELADRMHMHVVEFRKERDVLPIVLASPSDGFVTNEPIKEEEKNLDTMYFDNRLPLNRGRKRYFFADDPGHLKAQRRKKYFRNVKSARLQRMLYDLEPKNTRWVDDIKKEQKE